MGLVALILSEEGEDIVVVVNRRPCGYNTLLALARGGTRFIID